MSFPVVDSNIGFRWGPMHVERVLSDERYGVLLQVRSFGRRVVEIRISPAGQVMDVFLPGSEPVRIK